MELWKLLLITLLAAVVLGCLAGVLLGRHQLKKLSGNYRPLLSTKERVIYLACILLGAGCIAFGLLYTSPATQVDDATGESGEVQQEDGMNAGMGADVYTQEDAGLQAEAGADAEAMERLDAATEVATAEAVG